LLAGFAALGLSAELCITSATRAAADIGAERKPAGAKTQAIRGGARIIDARLQIAPGVTCASHASRAPQLQPAPSLAPVRLQRAARHPGPNATR
jgi:hypothetical protein